MSEAEVVVVNGDVEEEQADPVAPGAALTNRTTVRQLVLTFQRAEAMIRSAFANICAAQEMLDAAFLGSDTRTFRVDASRGRFADDFTNPDAAINALKISAWGTIVERLELRKTMSVERYQKMARDLEGKGDPLPDITEENIVAFVAKHAADLQTNFREAVAEVFDWLRPHERQRAAELKTNQRNARLELGEVVITSYMVEATGWKEKPFRVRYGNGYASDPDQRLIALENVFSLLDGQGGIKGYKSALGAAINASADGKGETAYFAFRACKNGNLHVRFLRPDLLARFNQIAGGMRLRPEQSAAHSYG